MYFLKIFFTGHNKEYYVIGFFLTAVVIITALFPGLGRRKPTGKNKK
jgi:hypothetical protein